ncbi:Pimeloyl-ACP methyl ester carboxylesterase [Solimonas aquatica]|uniref:Pimeloyl-ACP methyl ester carboxylesterase n=1 Tax=Solimonas aquatica TaxID=489703 RepID=A0A1H9JP61_9GAMM|nr:alpha/beta hydrolase [Solimonas aquatica]SEQ88711.1 Pimeloyl-ACP methyl ester carboxylesterase [Solimonas aquatica]
MSLSRWRDSGAHFTFHNYSIFYQAHGQGDVALLLLHDFPTGSWDFEPMWPALIAGFEQVLAPDLLGLGFSDKPAGHRYSLGEQTDLCVALLRERGVTRVHLLAHGYGVSIAQELLARMQQADGAQLPQVQSCVFLNGGLFPELHRLSPIQKLLRSPLGSLLVRFGGERRFNRSFCAVFGAQTQPGPIELHDYWTLMCRQNGRRVLRRLLAYVAERRRHRERWVGAMQSTTVPLLLICGQADPVAGDETAARFAQVLPAAERVLLEGIGHYPQLEAPDRVIRAFFDFHRRHSGLTWPRR